MLCFTKKFVVFLYSMVNFTCRMYDTPNAGLSKIVPRPLSASNRDLGALAIEERREDFREALADIARRSS